MRSYASDDAVFETWCAEENIAAFPAEIKTVCEFLSAQAQTMTPTTGWRRLYAILKVHRLLDLPDPTQHEGINLALRRVRRMKLNRPKQAKGLTRDYLDKFLAAQPENPWGLQQQSYAVLGL